MKTNLLLLDSYKNIENLVIYAFSFSNRTKRSLKIKYVFDFNWMRQSYFIGSGGAVDPALVAVEKNAKKEFEVAETKIREIAAEYLKKHSVNVPFEIQVTETNRIDLVEDELEKSPDMLLLISNHQSYSEASGGLVGYPDLIEHAGCPVFVIPEDIKISVVKDVMYATDYHADDLDALKNLMELLEPRDDVRINILHNAKEYDFTEKMKWLGFQEIVKKETGGKNLEFTLKMKKDTVHAIQEYVDEKDPDLLVVLNEKRGFFEEIFSTSETKSVLSHFDKPVLVYHEK